MAAVSTQNLNSEIINLEMLKNIYKSLQNSPKNDIQNEISIFKNTALEPYESEKDLNELLQRKYYSLKSLMLLAQDLTDDFFSAYYKTLSDLLKHAYPNLRDHRGFTILDGFVNISTNLNDKLLLLQTLTISLIDLKVNISVFEEFPPGEWRKELLLHVLFSGRNLNIDDVDRVIGKINQLSDLKGHPNVIEDLLSLLVINQNEFQMDVHFIDDLIFAITHNQQLVDLLLNDFHKLQDEINNMKMNMIKQYCSKFGANMLQKHLTDLNFFLKYPLEVIRVLTMAKTMKSFEIVLNIKQLLEICDMDLDKQVKILLQHDPTEPLDKMKKEIAFEIAKNIISNIFLSYENYIRCVNTSNKILESIHLVSSSNVKCSCFNVSKKCDLHNTTECCDLLYVLHKTIAKIIYNCNDPSEQLIDLISTLVARINCAKRITELINAMDTIDDYNIEFTNKKLNKFLCDLTTENYESAVHRFTIDNVFPGTYTKSVGQLMDEMEKTRAGVTNSIIEMFDGIRDCYKKSSILVPDFGKISKWDSCKIKLWSIKVRRNKNNSVSTEEILAVIKRAAQLTVNLELRDVQILAVLSMITARNGKGRLAQINTGEGKTLVIAVLAAYWVFKGHQVDIYTSSSVLAIPQSEEYEQFYRVCDISVTHNINPHSRYDCDVIYGTNSSFQRDVLLDEFRKSGVRKDRKYDVAIVDEVDNMLIDGNNWILKIACDMPAMDYLEVLLAAIYLQVNASANALVERNGETYYLSEENAIDEQGNIKPEVVVQEIPVEGSKRDFIIKSTEIHLRKLIRDVDSCEEIEKDYPEIKIPNHLREVICKVQLKKWIVSAINAMFSYTKNEDYILKDGKVTIVDADNTGVIKKNSHWCAGLHQFLEIKHGAKVQQENFTTNFISNVGLFTRYTSKLYGLTGTLGSNDTRSFLHDTYEVDSVVIPPFKLKQHQTLKPIVVSKNEDRYIEIAKSCIRILQNGRAALVIMKYIKETDELAEIFSKQFKYDSSKIKLFKTDDDTNIVEKTLQPGDVIITTNIAGRGTDIKLSKTVEENGGLHVCLTFLPVNSRVEHQNIGRTSRKGNKGTSQLILCDPKGSDIETLKLLRNIQEMNVMKGASESVRRVKIKDNIFHKFCDLLDKIKGRGPKFREAELKAVEERFAIWLILNEHRIDNNCTDNINELFDEFKKEILKDDQANTLIKNPYMYVEIGNNFLNEKNYKQAIEEYTSAILLDHCFAEHAYYNRAWAYLGEYGHDMDKNEHFINEAIRDLKKARKLIVDKEYSLHLLQTASKGEVFSEQVSHKLNLYGIQKNTIDIAIGPDVDAIDEQLKKFKEDQNNNNLPSDYKSKLNEYIENLEKSKEDIGVLGRARRNKRNITIDPLEDDFMSTDDKESHKDEIEEFKRNGWIGGFKITEIKPIDWSAVFGLLAIGMGQLIIGAALTVFTLGAGASIGMGLISEGISDIITAVKDGIINRSFDWATWALMKVISIAVSVVCAGFKAIKDVARTTYSGSKTLLTQGAKSFTQLRTQGWKIVAKKIGVDLAKGVAKEIATDLITYGIDKTLLPKIEEMIIEQIKNPIQKSLIENPKVKQMLKIDQQNQNNNYQNRIKHIAQNLLTPHKNSMLKMVSLKIATCVADNKGYAVTRQVFTIIKGSYEFTTFTSDFIRKMNSEINKIKIISDTDNSPPENLQDFHEDDIYDECVEQEIGPKKEDDIDLKKLRQDQEQIRMKKKVQTAEKLINELAGMVSTNMLHILKGKIITPITQMGVSYTADKISAKLHTVDKQIENYRSLKNIVHYQNKPKSTAYDDSQISMSERSKVDEIIERIERGGPAGLIHLGAISNSIERPIAVYDEQGRHKFTIGDSKTSPPIEVQYHAPKDGSNVGHFTLKGAREPRNTSEKNNMCLFNVVAECTGHDPNELKNMTLDMMRTNKSVMAKQVDHIRRLEMYDKSSLLEGGAQYNGRHPDHAREFYRNATGVIGFGNVVAGHMDKHIAFKGKTVDKLNAIVDESGRQIEIYDKKGNLDYIVGQKKDNVEPIKLQYHKPKGDSSAEYFSSVGGDEKYYLNDPNDTTLYDIISKQTGTNATQLKAATLTRMDNFQVPPTKTCLENETKKRPRTGFMSEDDAVYVLHHALQTQAAKDGMDDLNQYEAGVKDSEDYKKKEVYISAKELNLPRPAYGGYWKKGKLQVSWPVKDVVLVLQHYKGQENNPDARVHIQTFFPKPP